MKTDQTPDISKKRTGCAIITVAAMMLIFSLGLYFFVYRKDIYRDFFYYFFDNISSKDSILLLAFLGGIAGFFSPCAFALLPAYVSYYLSTDENPKMIRMRKSIRLGMVCASGILIFTVVVGIIVMIIGNAVKEYIPMLTLVIGTVIIFLGAALLKGIPIRIPFIPRVSTLISRAYTSGKRNQVGSIFLYGIGYGAASSSCSSPIFIALILASAAFGGVFLSFAAFLLYGLAMGILMVTTTVMVALCKDNLLNRLMVSTSGIKKASGLVMVAIGVYLVYFQLAIFIAT